MEVDSEQLAEYQSPTSQGLENLAYVLVDNNFVAYGVNLFETIGKVELLFRFGKRSEEIARFIPYGMWAFKHFLDYGRIDLCWRIFPYMLDVPELLSEEEFEISSGVCKEKDPVKIVSSDELASCLARSPLVSNYYEELLNIFKELPENWDGEFGVATDPNVAKMALDILHIYARDHLLHPVVMPTYEGGVSISWKSNKVHIQIDVLISGMAAVYIKTTYDSMMYYLPKDKDSVLAYLNKHFSADTVS